MVRAISSFFGEIQQFHFEEGRIFSLFFFNWRLHVDPRFLSGCSGRDQESHAPPFISQWAAGNRFSRDPDQADKNRRKRKRVSFDWCGGWPDHEEACERVETGVFCCALVARQVTFSTLGEEQQLDHLQEALCHLLPLIKCLRTDQNDLR